VRLSHFEALRPHCPVCRKGRGELQGLSLATVIRREGDVILEGVLACSSSACQREYPVLDGIPIILAGLRGFLSENVLQVMMRSDLSDALESILGDCTGPGSAFNTVRQQLSCYAWDHYGADDPDEPNEEPRPGAAVRALGAGLELAGACPDGPLVDLGCSVGGTTFALAERTGRLVVGIDLNLAMLRLASTALLRGVVKYPRRCGGVVYDKRCFPIAYASSEMVDFWACDVAALPFGDGFFGAATLLNVLDCVQDPRSMLVEAGRVLVPDGKLIVTSPYDWSGAATPIETWIGGHSQRSPLHGDSAAALRALLTPGVHPAAIDGLALEAELDDVPWHVRLHDRSSVSYRLHVVTARKAAPTVPRS
jgi:SAM-dependent methyltransferase/uncharacterized protein YbaR (Trm112 family)